MNKRLFREILGLLANGVSVGGNTAISVNQGFVNRAVSRGDGMQGPSSVSRSGQQTTFSLATEDIEQGIALLLSTPGSMVFFGKESGAVTYGKATLLNPVFNTLAFDVQLSSYATITMNGQCRYPAAASTFKDVFAYLGGEAKPTIPHPLRQWLPGNVTHGTLVPKHIVGVSFNLAAALHVAFDGNDIGTTDVEVGEYGPPTVSITFQDKTKHATNPIDIATQLMENGVEDVVIPLQGVGDTSDRTLTLRNVEFDSVSEQGSEGYTQLVLNGTMNFRDPTTPWTIRTIDHATPAERLVNFG